MDIFWKCFEDVKIATFDENVEGDDCATKKDFMEQKEKKRNYWAGDMKFVKAGFAISYIKIVVS